MKKILYFLFLILLPLISFAQKDIDEKFVESEKVKSGNYRDVLNSFYQLALKSYSPEDKSLDVNVTLFGLAKHFDKDMFHDANVSRSFISFLRNFQINGKINLEDDFSKVTGYTGGITFAVINKRDKNFVDYTGTILDIQDNRFNSLLIPIINAQIMAGNSADDITLVLGCITDQTPIPAAHNILGSTIVGQLDAAIIADPVLSALQLQNGTNVTTAALFMQYLNELDAQYIKQTEFEPLWTVSADGTTNTDNKFDKASISSVFLLAGSTGEWDARAIFSYADTLSTQGIRTNVNAKLGYNFKVLKNSEEESYFEIKAYGEYNKILRNPLPDEKEDTFLANAEIRLRLTDDLWLPFTIKYDVENANVLGFLNITYNFGDD